MLLHTAQAELPATRPGDVEVHFGAEIAPEGFAWVVPVSRGDQTYARVGVMCARAAPSYFMRMVGRISARWGISVEATPEPRQKVLPLSAIARTYGDRMLVVGDAAGLVKPTTGGGIYYSLLSATLAADVLSDALARGDLGARVACRIRASLARASRRRAEHAAVTSRAGAADERRRHRKSFRACADRRRHAHRAADRDVQPASTADTRTLQTSARTADPVPLNRLLSARSAGARPQRPLSRTADHWPACAARFPRCLARPRQESRRRRLSAARRTRTCPAPAAS